MTFDAYFALAMLIGSWIVPPLLARHTFIKNGFSFGESILGGLLLMIFFSFACGFALKKLNHEHNAGWIFVIMAVCAASAAFSWFFIGYSLYNRWLDKKHESIMKNS